VVEPCLTAFQSVGEENVTGILDLCVSSSGGGNTHFAGRSLTLDPVHSTIRPNRVSAFLQVTVP
jgi:hypothetical protein